MVTVDGASARYEYDAAGNTTAVHRFDAGAMVVFAVTPQPAVRGGTITVTGVGFAATAPENDVTIGGAPAEVTAATTRRLVVRVPAGADTGKLRVTTAAASSESADDVVIETGPAPQITGVSSTLVTPGDDVTVTGSGFDTAPANDVATINEGNTGTSAASATSLTVNTVATTTSGPIRVRTPRGRAVGPDVYVVPSGIDATRISTTRRLENDAPKAIELPQSNSVALAILDEPAGTRFYIELAASTLTGCTQFQLLAPSGDEVNRGCAPPDGVISGGTAGSGTYTLQLRSNNSSPGTFTATLHRLPATAPAVEIDGPAVPLAAPKPGTAGLATFVTSRPNQRVQWTFSGLSPQDAYVFLQVRRPDGTSMWAGSSGEWSGVQTLPSVGTYTAAVAPRDAGLPAARFQVASAPADAVAGPAVIDGPPVTLATTERGQVATTTFTTTTTNQKVQWQTGPPTAGWNALLFPDLGPT